MSKKYIFECYDEDNSTTTNKTFYTDSDAWTGVDGPMFKMFEFLKGCGFIFGINDQIGVMKENGVFRPAVDEDE
jgi:hypothetical protein